MATAIWRPYDVGTLQFTPYGYATNLQNINRADYDTNYYNYCGETTGLYDIYGYVIPSGLPADAIIDNVVFNSYAGTRTNGQYVYFYFSAYIGTTWYNLAQHNVNFLVQGISETKTTSPATGVAWTLAEVNALATAYIIICPAGTGGSKVFQHWIEVTYHRPIPEMTIYHADLYSTTGLTVYGEIVNVGSGSLSERGFCWNTTGNPTVADNYLADTGTYTAGTYHKLLNPIITGGNTYYIKSVGINAFGTAYSPTQITFPFLKPAATTSAVSNIASTSATGNGEVTSTGSYLGVYKGMCWNTTGSPTTADSKAEAYSYPGTGIFTTSITGLTKNTTYYVKAYAKSLYTGTSYGSEVSFTTSNGAVFADPVISSIAKNTAVCSSNITSDGGDTITARGVCWSTVTTPTTSDSKTTDGSGAGIFTSSITSLGYPVIYYVRSYATNGIESTYSAEINFKTDTVLRRSFAAIY